VRTGLFLTCFVSSTVDMSVPSDLNLLAIYSLLLAGGIDPDVDEAIAAMAAVQSVSQPRELIYDRRWLPVMGHEFSRSYRWA